jgi:tetratricopeptide (TPR) repeat protein
MPEIGQTISRYKIIEKLGEGGMGVVYKAEDLQLQRTVALKFLPEELSGDRQALERFQREARAAAALDHPNICAVYEVGETSDGRVFLAMQYVAGETLASILHRGPMPVREALSLCARITEALAAAHKRGIVHRDLKPQNIIVTPSGQPKLLDFGLAKSLSSSTGDPEAPTRSMDTAEGIIKGTPAYMAPEQIQQRPVDGRTDLFALGAVLFECLTWRRAFNGANALEVFGQILHVHPPAVSSLRHELTEKHDELCRRLLAKDPADRFQSAEEVTGALRLLTSDSSRDAAGADGPSSEQSGAWAPPTSDPINRGTAGMPHRRRRITWKTIVVGAVVLAAAGMAGWAIRNMLRALPPVPAEAERWYRRGTESIRDGAYYSGQLALCEAIRLFPRYPLAHARMAEVLAELDDERGAQEELLRLSSVLPDESRLPADDRIRLQGTRALVLRELEPSVAAYRRLVERHSKDATAWLDLGRAQESAGKLPDARGSYQKAIEIDPQYAAARMRLGSIEAQQSKRREALAAFAEAERLHHVEANAEGEAEVYLRRGNFSDALGDSVAARADFERALGLATTLKGTYQIVRARLGLSSVTASEGRFADAEKIAGEAVQQALDAGIDTVAADGLVNLAATLLVSRRLPEAAAKAQRAIELAQNREARRTAARAQIQLASVRFEEGKLKEALGLAEQAISFLKPNSYRRLEFEGLSVMARVCQQLDDLEHAHAIWSDLVASAKALGNDALVCRALSSLASVTTTLGQLTQALSYRQQAEAIRRRLNDVSQLPYDLANRAELLISLGRSGEASEALDELDKGIKAGIDSYMTRARRAVMLRGLAGVTMLRNEEAVKRLQALKPAGGNDQTYILAQLLLRYARSRLGQQTAALRSFQSEDVTARPDLTREGLYWLAAAALEEGNSAEARSQAELGLQLLGDMGNDELRWRLAAVCVLALRNLGQPDQVRDMASRAEQALARLRSGWGAGFEAYEKRPDLAELKARLGSTQPVKGG